MLFPQQGELEEKVGGKYALVVLAARRARQVKEGAEPLVDTPSQNAISIALEEVQADRIRLRDAEMIAADEERNAIEAAQRAPAAPASPDELLPLDQEDLAPLPPADAAVEGDLAPIPDPVALLLAATTGDEDEPAADEPAAPAAEESAPDEPASDEPADPLGG